MQSRHNLQSWVIKGWHNGLQTHIKESGSSDAGKPIKAVCKMFGLLVKSHCGVKILTPQINNLWSFHIQLLSHGPPEASLVCACSHDRAPYPRASLRCAYREIWKEAYQWLQLLCAREGAKVPHCSWGPSQHTITHGFGQMLCFNGWEVPIGDKACLGHCSMSHYESAHQLIALVRIFQRVLNYYIHPSGPHASCRPLQFT